MLTFLYAFLHMLVDGICAFRMYGFFRDISNYSLEILIYNFCAFALQLPIGVVYDTLAERLSAQGRRRLPLLFVAIGVMMTVVGGFTMPAIMGIGNAFFHIGGGMGTLDEDRRRDASGGLLGIFVAPGAVGLYIGGQLCSQQSQVLIFVAIIALTLLVLFLLALAVRSKRIACPVNAEKPSRVNLPRWQLAIVIVLATVVVIIRSLAGSCISYQWKNTFLAGLIATLLLALGKAAGGLLSSKLGMKQTVFISLSLAAVFYLFKDNMLAGGLAIFFFQMTMPITLYLAMQLLRNNEAMAFGLLTFGLFIGFLPGYLHISIMQNGALLGMLCSLISLLLLYICAYIYKNVDLPLDVSEN